MKALRVIVFSAALAGISLAQSGGAMDSLHMACFVSDSTVYTIAVDASGSTFTQGSLPPMTYDVLHQPTNGGDWHLGVKFGRAAQQANLFPTDDKVKNATWTHDAYSRADTMTFTTKHESQYVFSSTSCPGWNNCPYFGGSPKHCWDEFETCCGYNTMYAQCVPKNTTDKCCVWYAAAAVCNSTQSCCGGLGPGASSYANCCNQGSSCCRARSYGISSCCPAGTTCCSGSSVGLCCAAGETCDPYNNRCVAPTTTTTTAASESTPAATMTTTSP